MRNKKKFAAAKAVLLILAVFVCACVCNPVNARADEMSVKSKGTQNAEVSNEAQDSGSENPKSEEGSDSEEGKSEDKDSEAEDAQKSITAKIPVYCEESKSDETFTFKIEGEQSEFAKIENEELKLKSGEKGYFEVTITYPGNYLYSAAQIAGSDSKTTYDNTLYQIDIYVTEAEDGSLQATPVLYKKGSDGKVAELNFKNIKEIPETASGSAADSAVSPAKTGDQNNTLLWAAALCLSGMMLAAFAILKNKKRREAKENER